MGSIAGTALEEQYWVFGEILPLTSAFALIAHDAWGPQSLVAPARTENVETLGASSGMDIRATGAANLMQFVLTPHDARLKLCHERRASTITKDPYFGCES